MGTFIEQANEKRERAKADLEKATDLLTAITLLPKELTEYNWGGGISAGIGMWWNSIELELRLFGDAVNQEKVSEIKDYLGKEMGFSFEKITHEYADSFCYTGKLEGITIDDKLVNLTLGHTPKPQNCRLVKKIVTKEVVEYEAICEDTGKVI